MDLNQEQTHIITYRNDEIKILFLDPFRLCSIIPFKKIKFARMYYRTNLIFFVGQDSVEDIDTIPEGSYPSNILYIHDVEKKVSILGIKTFAEIDDMRCIKDFITVLSGGYIYVYTLKNFNDYIHKFKIINKNFCLTNNNLLIYIEKNIGHEIIKIKNLVDNEPVIELKAHKNKIKYMSVNNTGSLLATSSERGTLIRIFSTESGKKLYEFRRGMNGSNILHISFSNDSNLIAVMSDRGTIHIYNLADVTANRKSILSVFGGYFDSEWSFAWYYDESQNFSRKCCFNKNNDLLIVSDNNICHKLTFDKINGGLCTLIDKYQQ